MDHYFDSPFSFAVNACMRKYEITCDERNSVPRMARLDM